MPRVGRVADHRPPSIRADGTPGGGGRRGQLFRRKVEYVTAVQFQPWKSTPGVEVVRRRRKLGKRYIVSDPLAVVHTPIGAQAVLPGDWIITYADGQRDVWPDGMFRLAWEAV